MAVIGLAHAHGRSATAADHLGNAPVVHERPGNGLVRVGPDDLHGLVGLPAQPAQLFGAVVVEALEDPAEQLVALVRELPDDLVLSLDPPAN